jgi:hypothetical protein
VLSLQILNQLLRSEGDQREPRTGLIKEINLILNKIWETNVVTVE